MTLLSQLAKDSCLGALCLIIVGIIGVLVLACIEIPKWCFYHLGRLTLFLLDYNEHRPDMPRGY